MNANSLSAKEKKFGTELFKNIMELHQEMVARLTDVEISEMYFMNNFYSQSYKVYKIQRYTMDIIALLRRLCPSGMVFNPLFEEISKAGTKDTKFDLEHNDRWLVVTRPMLEAFLHARFFLSKAVECGCKFDGPPEQLISQPLEWVTIYRLFRPVERLRGDRKEDEQPSEKP